MKILIAQPDFCLLIGHPRKRRSDAVPFKIEVVAESIGVLVHGVQAEGHLVAQRLIEVSGDDATIIWKTVGGRTNVVQSAASLTDGFTDLSPALSIPGTGEVTRSYTHNGGGIGPTRFYRVRSVP